MCIFDCVSARPTDKQLAAAYRRRGSVVAVAADLGVAFETARRWLIDAGIELQSRGRPSRAANRVGADDLIDRYQRGESVAAIASATGVSPGTVRNRLLDAGIALRPRPGWKY